VSDDRFWHQDEASENSAWLGSLGGETADGLDAIAAPRTIPELDWDAEPPMADPFAAPVMDVAAPAAPQVAEVPVVPVDEIVPVDPEPVPAVEVPARPSPFMAVVPTEPDAEVTQPVEVTSLVEVPVAERVEPMTNVYELAPASDTDTASGYALGGTDEPIAPVVEIAPADPGAVARPSAFAPLHEVTPSPAVPDETQATVAEESASLDWLAASGDDLLPRR
jgi:hypothetical protein